jgi:hypothetical protein
LKAVIEWKWEKEIDGGDEPNRGTIYEYMEMLQ